MQERGKLKKITLVDVENTLVECWKGFSTVENLIEGIQMRFGLSFTLIVWFCCPILGQDAAEHNLSERRGSFASFTAGHSITDEFAALKTAIEEQSVKLSSLEGDIKAKVSPGSSAATMKLVGRVHADYWGFPETSPGIDALEGGAGPQDRLGFRRVRFGVRGDLPSNMEYRIEMEFAGGNKSEFRDAWLGFNSLPFFQKILIGNQKRPFGLDHLNSSRFNIFLERPFVIESFNQDARRLGIQSYGVSEDLAWNWRYGVFNQRLIQDEGNYTNAHWQPQVAGRLAKTWWYDEASDGRSYGHIAVSSNFAFPDGSTPSDNGSVGPDANEARFRTKPEARAASRWLDTGAIAGADHYDMLGVEKVLNFGSLQIGGEYQTIMLSRDAGMGPDVNLYGGYVYTSYFLTGEHMPWSRKSGTLSRIKPLQNFYWINTENGCRERGLGAWQIAFRYSWADFNSDNVLGGEGESLTAGLNWYWSPNARMQFNYIHGSIVDKGAIGTGGDYDIIGTRFMVDF